MTRKLSVPKNFRYVEPRSCCMTCKYLVNTPERVVYGITEYALLCQRDENSTPEESEFYNYVCDGFKRIREGDAE